MTDSKHHVEEPRMVEKQIAELLEEEVRRSVLSADCLTRLVFVGRSRGRPLPSEEVHEQ